MTRTRAFTAITAVVISVAMLFAGVASADTYATPAQRQQAIDLVIKRAMSQVGVPFTYGGGDVNGPSLPPAAVERAVQPEQSATGLAAANPDPLVPSLLVPAAPAAPAAPRVPGFDASGLIVYAFGGVGIKMPRSSGEQYKVGRKILPSQALPGDLLFFGPDGTQSVSMFIGDGKMIGVSDTAVAVSPVRTTDMAPYLSRIIEW
ncbi:NlpC/P60 family peptidoglycan-binding protein RipD [Mycolicibacterium sediminis]|uniref:Hydrolase n=1 Tax=Mycolicibacterium sediminis TaxID=1286180 RepID=A0A7I7QV56_9MYCO|nr:NlpC/P60 family peptidoglycan-binding protein RipD [Mycolicibacterium sediminis]BBY30238.1 hydrolase [Mycolicibacterium sediminis]